MRDDRGTVAVWVLGLCVGLLFLGGLSLDLWRAFTERRVLAGLADGSVVAGATAIDEEAWRSTGVIALDPIAATDRVETYLLDHPAWDPGYSHAITAASGGVRVELEATVDFTLLSVLLESDDGFEVSVDAFAEPVVSP